MAIRFQCVSCSQPIEIDDEWASKPVACPYCKNTITAPPESTLAASDEVPVASPLAAPETRPPPPTSNRIALVALVLASCAVFGLYLSGSIASAHSAELRDFEESMQGITSFSAAMEAQQDFYKRYPGSMQWMVLRMLIVVGALLLSLAAVICGSIGVRRPVRRRMAVVSIMMGAVVPLVVCAGMV